MKDSYLINLEIKKKFTKNKECTIKEIIDKLSNFDPLLVKSVITQGIINNNYIITKNKTPFTNSTIKIVSHQEYLQTQEDKRINNLALSIPPFHKSTVEITLERENVGFISIYDLFVDMIKNAMESIKICSPFFDPAGLVELQNLLIKKANEGVKIQILTRELNEFSEEETSRIRSIRRFKARLTTDKLKNNISIKNYHFEDERKVVLSSIHAKLLIVDNLKAYLGSGEFRANSFRKNFEMGIQINEKETVNDILLVFNLLYSIARAV